MTYVKSKLNTQTDFLIIILKKYSLFPVITGNKYQKKHKLTIRYGLS